jgi:hypothetical protein
MIYAAIIAASLAVVALVVFAVRFGGMSGDLAASESDRDRLEDELRELVADDEKDDQAAKERIRVLLEEREKLREEINRRRRPGDARARLRLLSETSEATDSDSQDGP